MSNQLLQMLKSHEFLQRSMEDHGDEMSSDDSARLRQRLDQVFIEILNHEAADVRVTLTQIRFVLDSLASMIPVRAQSRALSDVCRRHIARLEGEVVTKLAPKDGIEPQDYRYLNSLSDRVGILDRNYRYVFSNTANNEFHRKSASDFVGRANWEVVGSAYFEQTNKARFDACFAGNGLHLLSPHPLGPPDVIHSVKIEPVLGRMGRIEAIMIVAREVPRQVAV